MSKYTPRPTDPIIQHLTRSKMDRKPWNREQQKLTDIELTDEFFKNEHGCFRWDNIRNAYFNEFIDVNRVVDLYTKWRDQTEYLWLEAIDLSNNNEVVGNFFFKCAKRGNDVYKSRLNDRFNFLDSLDPIYFFLDIDPHKHTPMVFLTLTVDPKKYTLDDAWFKISDELHLFESKLRQKYGSFVKFRVWEAHASGYPHCHVVYYFHDKWFKVFNHKNKYRITTIHKDSIEKMWLMGNVDIQAVQDTHGAFSEVKKYITKNIWNKKGELTNAMICLYRKQMYSLSACDPYKKMLSYIGEGGHSINDISLYRMHNLSKWAKKDFIGAIWGTQIYYQFYKECGNLAEPGAATLVREFVHNCNNENIKFRYVGCVAAADLCGFLPNLNDEWLIYADPPPEFKFLMGFNSELFSFEDR